MKKFIVLILIIVFLVCSIGSMVIAGPGPAPNSSDGNPDGSGFDGPLGEGNGPGPAPNSGDGIPDGPGW